MKLKTYLITGIFLMAAVSNVQAESMEQPAKKDYEDMHKISGFIQNKGQITDQSGNIRNDIKYFYNNKNFKFHLKSNGFSYELYHNITNLAATPMSDIKGIPEFARNRPELTYISHRVDVRFLNSNPNPVITNSGMSEDFVNYYYHYTANEGVTNVRNFDQVRYQDVYPGIDLIFHITGKGLKYDVIVKPGANLNNFKMIYEGADNLTLSPEGSLKIMTKEGFIEETIPSSFLSRNPADPTGSSSPINIRFKLDANILSFNIPEYDGSQTLTIDPEIVWGSYYGYTEQDGVNAVQHDELSNILAAGYTGSSSNIASSGAFQTTFGGSTFDAFLVKLDHSGKRVWATYCGGDSLDVAQGVAADKVFHSIYLMGYTSTRNGFSSTGSYQEDYGGGYYDAFLAKFDQLGQRNWCTYYGGSDAHASIGGEYIYNAAIDERFGDVYITGVVSSRDNMATDGAQQDWMSGEFDAILAKFTVDGELDWGTYCGGTGFDGAYGITLDPSGYITIGGYTVSDNTDEWGEELIATEGSYQETRAGASDAFIERYNLRGTRQWGTYYGGPADELVYCTAADKSKNIYIGGSTASTSGISTAGSHQAARSDMLEGFIGKFSPTGSRLWASYYGGLRNDAIFAMYCDKDNNLAFTGITTSVENIATTGSFQPVFIGTDSTWTTPEGFEGSVLYSDGFLAYFAPAGTRLWGTYLGGWEEDTPRAMAIDLNNNIILGGETRSISMLTTAGTYKPAYTDQTDGFITKFGEFVKISNISTPFCVGNPINIAYETGTDMNSGNIFTAQLSDQNGSFANPVSIGTKTGSKDGVINAIIPSSTTPGTNYRIRIVSSNPSKTSADNGFNITINPLPVPVITGESPACSRAHLTYTATLDDNVTNSWTVTNGKIIGDSTMETVVIAWNDASEGTLKVIQTNTVTGCIDSISKTVTLNISPIPNIVGDEEVIAYSTESYRTNSQSSLTYRWEVSGGTINNDPTASEIEIKWGGVGTGTVKLVLKNKVTGCSDSLIQNIAINLSSVKITGKKTVCAHSEEKYSLSPDLDVQYKWSAKNGNVQGADNDTIVNILWGNPGTGSINIIRTNKQTLQKDTVFINITILDLPVVGILGTDELCEGSSEMYFAAVTSDVSNQWSVYNGIINGTTDGDTVRITWNNIPDGNDSAFVKATVFLTQTSMETGCSNTKEKIINLSAKPDAEIIGNFDVCSNQVEFYETHQNSAIIINEWFVTGGTISGSNNDSTLAVDWKTPGQGTIKLIQSSGTTCVDSNIVNVTIKETPPKPVISQSGDSLKSSAETGNQWFSSNTLIDGETGQTFYPPSGKSGIFTVQVTISNGCKSPMSNPFNYIGSVIDFIKSAEIMSVYPNPTSGLTNIEIKKDFLFANIKIRNIVGNIILNDVINSAEVKVKEFDISDRPAGIYILQLQIGENIYNYKVVKY